MKNTTVTLKELRENMEKYIDQIEKGKSFTVIKRSKPVFKITSPEEEESWETVIDFTKIKKGGVLLDDILSRL